MLLTNTEKKEIAGVVMNEEGEYRLGNIECVTQR